MSDFVTGGITALISFVLGLFGKIIYDRWHENYTEKKQTRKEALKNHFLDVDKKTITPLADQLGSLINNFGEISPSGQGRYWEPNDVNVSLNVSDEDWKIFAAHFNEQAKSIKYTIDKINGHNKEFDDFIINLKARLNDICPLSSSIITSPFFPAELLGFLRITLFQIVQNSYENKSILITHDFDNASIVKENGQWLLKSTTRDNGMKYSFLTSEKEAENCKQKLSGLQNSPELQKEAYRLYKNAAEIASFCKESADFLAFLRQYFTELGKTLIKAEGCLYCNIIFNQKGA